MYQLNKVKLDIKQASQRLATKIGQKELLQEQRDDAILRKAEAQRQLDSYDKVQILLQKTSEYARQQAKQRIEEIVSEALNVVFGAGHRFTIDLVIRSGRPECDYYLFDGSVTTKMEKPDYDRGGGKVDVISLALNLAVAELEGIQGTLWLDEVGKHVSADFAPNVAYFLRQYAEKFGRQIVLITHNQHLAEIGDRSLEVINRSGVSKVRKL